MVRPPMPPTYFFAFDVSQTAVRSGFLKSAIDTVRDCLDSMQSKSDRTRIGFITYDRSIHFLRLAIHLDGAIDDGGWRIERPVRASARRFAREFTRVPNGSRGDVGRHCKFVLGDGYSRVRDGTGVKGIFNNLADWRQVDDFPVDVAIHRHRETFIPRRCERLQKQIQKNTNLEIRQIIFTSLWQRVFSTASLR